MMQLQKVISFFVVSVLFASLSQAQEPIRFARMPDISPDGKQVAFSYLGDIWVVETIGGVARPVTMHEAHDIAPVFSPDGRMLAFSSNRHGSYDVFVVSIQGGKPRRLTFDSASDLVNGWSPDGKTILFTSNRSVGFPSTLELYSVSAEGSRVRRVSAFEGKDGAYSPKGDQIAYVRGPGTWYRKGYRGSSNDDIWLCNADGSNNRLLTGFEGQDSSPMWSPDGQFLYYVSEVCEPAGSRPVPNIVRQNVAGTNPPQLLTSHREDGVRRARISGNGEWIVYECGPDLWVVSTRDRQSRKLAIEVHADDKTNTERIVTFTQGASEFALARDEKHVAFVVHGQLFLMPNSGGKATRLTESTGFDHGIAWSPDSKKIIFASDRGGNEDLYLLEADDPENPELVKAHKFKARQLTNTPEAEFDVSFAPDGKRVGFIRAGRLWTMNPDGTDQKTLVNDVQVIDYDWSPDSKWIVYARMDGSFASELYVIPADGGPPDTKPKNITRYATYNAGVTWSDTGNKIAFISQRRQGQTMCVLSLQRPAAAGITESKEMDWEDIHLRVKQPAAYLAQEGAISMDGSKVAFRSMGSVGDDLYVANSDGNQFTRLTQNNLQPQQIQWSRRLPDLIYFRDGKGQIRMTRSGSPGEPALVPFKAKMTIRRHEEFQEMFEQSWHALRENFYDASFHGTDWNAIRLKYRPLVKHVAMKEDLYALISLMLGELNASHLGIQGFGRQPEERTAELGLIFDESYAGPGLKILEILKRGPAHKRGIGLRPGDIIRSIDRVDLDDKTCVEQLLNDKVGEVIQLQVTSSPNADPKDPKAWRKLEIQGTSRDQIGQLMYDRWVDLNTQRVGELSKGKLGYIHIPSMDEDGVDRFLRALYSENFDKEAIVLDVRYNGGGFTHDQILNYLGAKEHTVFRQRNGGEGMVIRAFDRKWSRPLVLLINNLSYSDAEIFPNAFRTLGLGKLVGQATGGHVIGTSSIRLIDGSTFRVPRTGVYTVNGINMEKEGVKPDIAVIPHPDQIAKGQDVQLDKAVEVLQQTVAEWKKKPSSVAVKPEGGKPAPAVGNSPPLPMGK
ncbi:MAG TPA: S41 family peptidase [Gemmataceae bacterium]|nr:S41 family peptidase [Gemmataceae bacterium]